MRGLNRPSARAIVGLLLGVAACGGGAVPESAGRPSPGGGEAAARVAPAPSAPVPDPFAEAAPEQLRGRVIDRATGRPWGEVWVRLAAGDATWTVRADAGGNFLAPPELPAGEVRLAAGIDRAGPWCAPGESAVAHEPADAAETLHRLRVAPGPEHALAFLEAAARHPERFEARLVEVGADGTLLPWSWQVLRPGEPPRLRYLGMERREAPGRSAWVELHQRGRDWFARARVPALRGDPDDPVELSLVQYGTVGGEVRDAEGAPLRECEVRLHAEIGGEAPLLHRGPRVARTDGDGRFRLDGVEPGHHELELRPEGRPVVRVHVDCEGGRAAGAVYEVASLSGAAMLPVALVGEREEDPPQAILVLRSSGEEGVVRVLHTRARGGWREQLEPVGVGHAAIFTGLPAARHELRVLGLDGRVHEPSRALLDLREPVEGVAVRSAPPGALHEWRPRVLLGEDELEGFRARLSGADWWFPLGREVAAGEVVGWLGPDSPTADWTLWAEGARPARGSAATWTEPGRVPDEVRLEAGWGAELVLRDASRARLPLGEDDAWTRAGLVAAAPPLADVEVVADGKRLGRTDALGRFFLALDAAPASLELRREGWRALDPGCTGEVDRTDPDALARAGTAVVWMVPAGD